MNDIKICPSCGNTRFESLVEFGVIPESGIFLKKMTDDFGSNIHGFIYCNKCALIQQKTSSSKNDYHEVNRPTRRQLPAYLKELFDFFYGIKLANDDLIVDIGGNDGAFLDILADAGYKNRLNVEPSVVLAEDNRRSGHQTENVPFNTTEAYRIKKKYGPASVVFCRHVIEHVPDPVDMLKAIRYLIDIDGYLFIETPDARGVIEKFLVHELWDEHLFHFTFTNLSRLLIQNGFCIEWKLIRPHRGGDNIIIYARPGNGKNLPKLPGLFDNKDVDACRHFKSKWIEIRNQIHENIQKWPKPIVCIGASHPQSNYIVFSGIGDYIDALVDDDPVKVGHFVPLPNPVPVISTRQLLENRPYPGTIIRSAFGCESWMNTICLKLKKHGVLFVDPYPVR